VGNRLEEAAATPGIAEEIRTIPPDVSGLSRY
jgi:hypothetical protein